MKVVHAFGRVFDVFTGEGWGNWTRLQATKTERGVLFQHVDGAPPTSEMFQRLNARFSFKKHYQNV